MMATKQQTIKETVALPGGNRFDIGHATEKQKRSQISAAKRDNVLLNIKKEQEAVRKEPVCEAVSAPAVDQAVAQLFGDES